MMILVYVLGEVGDSVFFLVFFPCVSKFFPMVLLLCVFFSGFCILFYQV